MHRRILRQVSDRARARPAVEPRERRAAPADGAAVRDETRERAQQRALAGAVRPDERHELAGLERDRRRPHGRVRFVANLDVECGERHRRHAPRAELRITRCRKNGAPSSAVTTPSLSSGPGGSRRIAMSASVASRAPPRKLGSSSRLGCWPTARRSRCGTTRPTKPTTPVTATAPPTASAVPPMTSHWVRVAARTRGSRPSPRRASAHRAREPPRRRAASPAPSAAARDRRARGCGPRASRASRTGSRARRTGSARNSARARSARPRAR